MLAQTKPTSVWLRQASGTEPSVGAVQCILLDLSVGQTWSVQGGECWPAGLAHTQVQKHALHRTHMGRGVQPALN